MFRSVLLRFKNEAIQLIIVSVIALSIILFGWNHFINTEFYSIILNFLHQQVGYFTQLISGLSDMPVTFDSSSGYLINALNLWDVILPLGAFPVYFALIIFVFVLPPKKYYTVLIYIFSTAAFIILRSTIIMLFKIYLTSTAHYAWIAFIDTTIYLPAYFWIVYLIESNNLHRYYSIKINTEIKRISYFTVQQIALFLILFNSLPRIILQYSGNAIENITTVILKGSQLFLKLLHYNTVLIDKTIFIDNNWVRLELPCIGIGVWTIVVILILSIRGSAINKAIFIPAFSLIFMLINSVRLAYTLLYLHDNCVCDSLKLSHLHDSITYVMYLFAFIFLATYILWFHTIKFNKKSVFTK